MPLITLGLAWLGGIYLGTLAVLPLFSGWTAVAAMGVFALWRRRPALLLVAALALSLMAGATRSQQTLIANPESSLGQCATAANCHFRGTVDDSPTPRGSGVELTLALDGFRRTTDDPWQATRTKLLVRLAAFPERHYGDYLTVSGRVDQPSTLEGRAYQDYLARRGVAGIAGYPKVIAAEGDHGNAVTSLLVAGRNRLAEVLQDALPEPEAGLAEGILLGRRALMAPDLSDAFLRTNTSHVIAISGANISLVAAILLLGLGRFTRRSLATIITIASIALYAIFVGASPSVMRAAVMGVFFAIGELLGRPRDATAGLVLAAGLMSAADPTVIFDLGFQLSFLATAGLVLLVEPLRRLFAPLPRFVGNLCSVTVAAELATTPLIVLNFGQLSLVGPVANLAVPALLPLEMAASGATALAGLASEALGNLVGYVAWLFLALMVWLVEALAAIPGAVLPVGNVGNSFVLAYYALLTAALLWCLNPTTPLHLLARAAASRVPAAPALGVLAVAAALSWAFALTLPADDLRVSVFDVGQGDAILVRTPESKVLVDGGPNPDAVANALGRALPFWDRSIDLVVLTHANEDHVAGLDGVLQRFDVKHVLATRAKVETASFGRFEELVRAKGIARAEPAEGQHVDLGSGVELHVLHPAAGEKTADNDQSIVLRVTKGSFAMLLAGDLGPAGRRQLIDSGEELDANVLKVPHHGSADGLDAPLLAAVSPSTAIISVGRGNRFGHPAPATINRLNDAGATVYRTDWNGTTEVVVQGDNYQIRTRR